MKLVQVNIGIRKYVHHKTKQLIWQERLIKLFNIKVYNNAYNCLIT